MTDSDVLNGIDKAKKAYKTACTKARRELMTAKDKAMSFFADADDVTRAARHNTLKRAELACDSKLNDARIKYIDRLEKIRNVAGAWADLVPKVR